MSAGRWISDSGGSTVKDKPADAQSRFRHPRRTWLVTTALFLTLASCVYLVWQHEVAHENNHIRMHTADVSDQAVRRLQTFVNSRLKPAEVFARRWSRHERRDYSQQRFRNFAAELRSALPGYHRIHFVTPDLHVRWTVPRGPQPPEGLASAVYRKALALASHSRRIVISKPTRIHGGRSGFIAVMALRRQDELLGYLVVDILADVLIGECFHDRIRSEFDFWIDANGIRLFGPNRSAHPHGRRKAFLTSRRFDVVGHRWQLTMVPRNAVASGDSRAHLHVLLLGVALALGLSLMTFLLLRQVDLLRVARDRAFRAMEARDEMERQKSFVEAQLLQAQKMEAVGLLAGGVAHDFNNLLTIVRVHCDLLAKELADNPPRFDSVGMIQRSADRATELTSQLLAFGRRQVLQPQVLNINSVVDEVSQILERSLGETVQLILDMSPTLWPVRVDPGQLQQVILNLTINARDAMPKGGALTIETVNTALEEDYCDRHPNVRPGDYVSLCISDTGEGMSEETRARIFEPFFTTKDLGKGTGLGLSTVYGIVRQSGGRVWVYSEVGKGTTFKIYFPRCHDSNLPSADAPAEPADRQPLAVANGSMETILVVEDDAEVRQSVVDVLVAAGYSVREATDFDEAIDNSRNHAGAIDLLLTDVVLPGKSGDAVARGVAGDHPEIKVLYMSGYTDNAIVHHGVLEPGTAFLAKPFTPDALTQKIREVLDGSDKEP